MNMKGKLIVIEGTDAVGKATQSGLLAKKLRSIGKKVEIVNFPTYGSEFGGLIKRYLSGEFGSISKLPPEVISMLYSLDRYQYRKSLFGKLSRGIFIICNRYSQSNLYQAAKIPQGKERDKFIEWFNSVEGRLPFADAVVFLNMPATASRELLKKRGEKIDLHEKDAYYQESVRMLYLEQSKRNHWAVVDCISGGSLKSKVQIASEIFSAVSARCGI